jgi:PST family polysaccharide transporter
MLQMSYYILPLITVPYLVRVLGPEKFGLVSFGQSLIAIFSLFVGYGYDLSATREISLNRLANKKVSRIAGRVWVAKAVLSGIGLSVILLLMLVLPRIRAIALLFIILYGIVIGNVLFPIWLFQGLERMKAISAINITMRTLSTAGVFILIRKPDDYMLYAGILSFQWIATGIVGMWFAFSRLKIRMDIPSIRDVRRALSDGHTLFLSQLAQGIYSSGNSFILGMLTDYTIVGYYSAAEKIVMALVGMIFPVTKAIYPRFIQMAASSMDLVVLWGRRVLYIMGSVGVLIYAVLLAGAPIIVNILLGHEYNRSINVLRILGILPLIIGITMSLNMQFTLPFGKDRAYTIIHVLAGPVNLLLAFMLVPLWNQNGMAIALVISESFICASSFIYLWHLRLSPFNYEVPKKMYHEPVSSH